VRRWFILSMTSWVRLFRGMMPELAGVPDGEFAVSVEWALRNGMQRWWTALVLGLQMLATAWGVGVLLPRLLWNPSLLTAVVIAPLCGGLAATGVWHLNVCWFFRGLLKRAVRQELNRRGWPVCLRCGYDLHAQTEPRCPECGTFSPELELAIQARRATQVGGQSVINMEAHKRESECRG
jgi:hypothetical protein